MTPPPTIEPEERPRSAVREFSEDVTGFGGAEWRTTRDLILRPAAVLAAYESGDRDLGGYTRPLRYYLTFNGLYLALIAVLGGFGRSIQQAMQPQVLEFLTRQTGKTAEALMNDFDRWYSLVAVPVLALAMFGPLFLLFRAWSRADARIGFRQTFTFMSGWSLYGAPFGLVAMFVPGASVLNLIMLPVVLVTLFVRLGRGRWWRTPVGLVLKTLALAVLALGAAAVGGFFTGVLTTLLVIILP